jgi:hypothetical protein
MANSSQIGFSNSKERINVALSRAQDLRLVLGSPAVLGLASRAGSGNCSQGVTMVQQLIKDH